MDDLNSSFFRKIEHLGIFSLWGTVIQTPLSFLRQTGLLLAPKIKDMIDNESTEFIEGFLAGLLYGGKITDMGGALAEEAGMVPSERREEIRSVHIDTVLLMLSDYLVEQRSRD